MESVELALNLLDEYDVKGRKIRVERAQFQMKGEYNPGLKPKRKKKDKEKLKKMQEKYALNLLILAENLYSFSF